MVTIIKLNPQGHEMIRYDGQRLRQDKHGMVIQAYWTMPARDLGYARFETGDRFTEYYYTDRWFNIFDIADANGTRRGWYCNIAEPAQIESNGNDAVIHQIDLYLDLWVRPDRETQTLDEDEYAAAVLTPEQRENARLGMQELTALVQQRMEAFA